MELNHKVFNEMKMVRILIVDDQLSVRTSLKLQFKNEANYRVVGEAKDGIEALTIAGTLQPDLILMDLDMPGVGGLEATSRMKDVCPGAAIIILSIQDDPQNRAKAREAGAVSFVAKSDVEILFSEIRYQASRKI